MQANAAMLGGNPGQEQVPDNGPRPTRGPVHSAQTCEGW